MNYNKACKFYGVNQQIRIDLVLCIGIWSHLRYLAVYYDMISPEDMLMLSILTAMELGLAILSGGESEFSKSLSWL